MDGFGRPRLYQDHDSFAAKVDEYFAVQKAEGKRPNIAGLSYFMGFADKQSFPHYATYGEDFSLTVNKAKLLMEDDRVQALTLKDSFTPGIIFDLKNNFGWKDKTEQEITVVSHEDALKALG